MSLALYTKTPLTFTQQVEYLEQKGMVLSDKSFAETKLASISYYRLSGYWYPFRIRDHQNNVTNQLVQGTSFEDVLYLYEFDRKLRSLVLDAIERVEIAVRTQFTYHIGHQYGAFGHTNPQYFHPKFEHRKWLNRLKSEVKRSKDDFIGHYKSKYQNFPVVPIWMLTEVMSLGALSVGYEGLKNGNTDKKKIAQYFNLHYKKLEDWLHVLTYIRNICAHHSRLWNRRLAITPSATREGTWLQLNPPTNDKIFYILLMLRHLLKATGNGNDWSLAIIKLLETIVTEEQWRLAMGMPDNWKQYLL